MKVIFPFTGDVSLSMQHIDIDHTLGFQQRFQERPTLTDLLEPLCKLSVSEFIFITSHQEKQIRAYIDANYSRLPVSFVEKIEEKGLGHTVSLASEYISNEPLLIVVGDTLLDLDWISFSQSSCSMIAVERVVDERPYGLVELREGIVGCLIHKPRRTDLALAGCFFIRESKLLFECLQELIQYGQPRNGGYQLTNALQRMIDSGVEMRVQEVELMNQEEVYKSSNILGANFETLNGV